MTQNYPALTVCFPFLRGDMAKSLTLAQAIARQKRLEQKLLKIYIQLDTNVKSVGNHSPKLNPDDLIKLASRIIGDIATLKNRIQKTYDQTMLVNGIPLWYALIKQQELQNIQAITREYEWQERSLNVSPLTLQCFDNVFEALFYECCERESFDNSYQHKNKNRTDLDYLCQLIQQSCEKRILVE